MEVVLQPGDELTIKFEMADGEFLVAFDSKKYHNQIVIKEMAGLPGSVTGKANAVLYREDYSDPPSQQTVTGRSKR